MRAIDRPDDVPAGQRGGLTIVDVLTVEEPQQYLQRIREWACDTWGAWSTHHALAREWIDSPEEMIATCGWSTFSNYVSITPDEKLDIEEIRRLLAGVESSIHGEKNRVRYTMNGFVIAVGSYIKALHGEAMLVAEQIGKVRVDVGDTACKVPPAADYIQKVELAGKLGSKRKTCIC